MCVYVSVCVGVCARACVCMFNFAIKKVFMYLWYESVTDILFGMNL